MRCPRLPGPRSAPTTTRPRPCTGRPIASGWARARSGHRREAGSTARGGWSRTTAGAGGSRPAARRRSRPGRPSSLPPRRPACADRGHARPAAPLLRTRSAGRARRTSPGRRAPPAAAAAGGASTPRHRREGRRLPPPRPSARPRPPRGQPARRARRRPPGRSRPAGTCAVACRARTARAAGPGGSRRPVRRRSGRGSTAASAQPAATTAATRPVRPAARPHRRWEGRCWAGRSPVQDPPAASPAQGGQAGHHDGDSDLPPRTRY
jgi:hypothetical protein